MTNLKSNKMKDWSPLAVMAGLFLVIVPVLYLSGLMGIEQINMLGRYLAFAILAIGLDLLWGYTGVLSLGHAVFFAFGGYAMGMYLAHNGPLDGADIPRCLYVVSSDVGELSLPWFWKPFASFPLAIFLGVFLTGLIAYLIAYPCFKSRVRGVYFSILTQAITVATWLVFCKNDIGLCGTNGLTNFVSILGFDLRESSTKFGLYLMTTGTLCLVYIMCKLLVSSQMGKVLLAIRDSESMLRFGGYKAYHYKVFIFVLSAIIAGISGMFYAPQMGIFTPSYMEPKWSIFIVVWVAFGGRGRLYGAVMGTIIINLMYNYLTSFAPDAWPFFLGGLFIAVVLYLPEGLASLGKYLPKKKSIPGGGDNGKKMEASPLKG